MREGAASQQGDPFIVALFNQEAEAQVQQLNEALLALEAAPDASHWVDQLMRASHSLKSAASVVDYQQLVQLAHALEEYFCALQRGQASVSHEAIDLLLHLVDLVKQCTQLPFGAAQRWLSANASTFEAHAAALLALAIDEELSLPTPMVSAIEQGWREPLLRITAHKLNRLMGLAGEALVESKWLEPFTNSLLQLRRQQGEISTALARIEERGEVYHPRGSHSLTEIKQMVVNCYRCFNERIHELEMFVRRYSHLSDQLYEEVISSRMRPFSEGIMGMRRMVRELARQLGKRAVLEVQGEATEVDREILEKLEGPLTHLLRNAVDHGIEVPEVRERKGKAPLGVITLEATHEGGMLVITLSDDGKGVDFELLRQRVIKGGWTTTSLAEKMGQNELLPFLFLPGFSTLQEVSAISGRGVGLNAVQTAVNEVGGKVHIFVDNGMTFQLLLPLTRSVVRALLVTIGGHPYAFPLARIEQVLLVERDEVQMVGGTQYFCDGEEGISLVTASQLLGVAEGMTQQGGLPIVVVADGDSSYGVIVDGLGEEREFVVQEIDPIFGKIRSVSSGAYLENGDPLLILDVDDMIATIETLIGKGESQMVPPKKRVLVIDDSMIVREVQCRLLQNHGYDVDSVVNGAEGWSALRLNSYALVITDIDMPRMNGVELIKAIRTQAEYRNLPIMVVSHKEQKEDREESIKAGANDYLAKSRLDDATFIDAVINLIGEP